MGPDAPCNLGVTVWTCLTALGGSGPPTLVETEPLLPLWLWGDMGSRGLWVGEARGWRWALPRACGKGSPSKSSRPMASSLHRGGKEEIRTQPPGINIKGILHAYIFFLREKLCCFGLPWFLVSLVTSQYGVGDERWGEGRRSQEKTGANYKDPEQGRWRQQVFFPGKKNKKTEWILLARMLVVFCTLWCFIIQKGEKIIQQN